jgi:polar amino acid transport system substrate-binding protein
MSYTDERAKSYDFTKPYAQSPMSVLVNTTLAKDVTKLSQLDDPKIKVAVQRGTTGETKARAAFPKATFMLYDTEADAAREVSTGRLHAFVYDFLSVEKFAKQSPDTTRVLDEDLGSERYCIAAKKGSPLTSKIDAFLAVATKPGGKVDELMKKWGLTPEKWRTSTK